MRGRWVVPAIVALLTCVRSGGAAPYVDPAAGFVVSAIPDQHQYNARIWGKIVVWSLDTSGDLWAKDMETGEAFFVGERGGGHFDIHEGTIVWHGPPNAVWAFDVSTRTKALVTNTLSDADPDVYGSRVVWVATGATIRLKDIETGRETTLPAEGGDPLIFGDNVVWIGLGMHAYKISSGVCFDISPTGTPSCDLHGNIVVWRDSRNYDDTYLDIYAADICDPNEVIEFPVCVAPGEQGAPAVYGDVVVWTDYRNGDMDIYGYDIVSGKEFPIAVGPGNQFAPAIYESLVVWSHEPVLHGNVDLHGNIIIPEPSALALLALGGVAVMRRRRR